MAWRNGLLGPFVIGLRVEATWLLSSVSSEREMKEFNEQALERKATPLTPSQSRAPTDSSLQKVHGAGPRLPRAGAKPTKRKGGQTARRRGRLDREVLGKLGKGLKDCFADVQNQEVPERFKVLLQQF